MASCSIIPQLALHGGVTSGRRRAGAQKHFPSEMSVVALVVLVNFLLQFHFKLGDECRADVGLPAPARFHHLGGLGDQGAGYGGDDGSGSVAGGRRRQTGGARRRRSGPGAAGAVLRAALWLSDQKLLGGVAEPQQGCRYSPRSLLPGPPLDDPTHWHNSVGLGVAHVHGSGKQDGQPD